MYAWKTGVRKKVSAEVAGKVCEELEKGGMLTASNLVNVSRPEDAPLHCEFEWHDHVAAEKYRESQAREIMRQLIVVADDKPAEPVRAFFNVSDEDPNYYSTAVIISEQDKYEALKQRAVRELIAIQKRYSMIHGLEALAGIIEQLQAS